MFWRETGNGKILHIAFFWLHKVVFKCSKLLVMANEDLGFGENLYRSLLDALRNVEQDLGSIVQRTSDGQLSSIALHLDLIEQLGATLRSLTCLNLTNDDSKDLTSLADIFQEVYQLLFSLYVCKANEATAVSLIPRLYNNSPTPGRPKYDIPKTVLEELRGLNFSWSKVSSMFGVSRWTIYRRVQEYELQNLQHFTNIADEDVDKVVKDYLSRHGYTTGEPYVSGYLKSKGIIIQRRRVRASINRVDPVNTAVRWGVLISRRTYYVPWPNSLWHIDGHHSLIRWKFVIHGCIDGKSRKIMFLRCNTNNLASTVLHLFLSSINEIGGYWPSRIRVDYGVENVLICDTMVERRGEGRGSFIAGPSTHNQRIERLWRDVFRCVAAAFYYAFYAMEQTGLLDVNNPVHMFALHLVFTPRINFALKEFMEAFNAHHLSSEHSWSPNQIWINGMIDPNNPLANNGLDDDPDSLELYGEDLQGPCSMFDEGTNNVVVSPDAIPHDQEVAADIYQIIDPNRNSPDMGIDIFIEVLDLVGQRMREYCSMATE